MRYSDNNLSITKADKGICLVVLNKYEHIGKTNEFLNSCDFINLDKNLFNQYIRLFRSTVSQLTETSSQTHLFLYYTVLSFVNTSGYNLSSVL